MRSHRYTTAFYLEVLLLIVALLFAALALARVFAQGRAESARAGELTRAVALAENAAEALAASDSPEELFALLDRNENASMLPDGSLIAVNYAADGSPQPGGPMVLQLRWTSEPSAGGEMVRGDIGVYYGTDPDPVYTLATASFRKGVTP